MESKRRWPTPAVTGRSKPSGPPFRGARLHVARWTKHVSTTQPRGAGWGRGNTANVFGAIVPSGKSSRRVRWDVGGGAQGRPDVRRTYAIKPLRMPKAVNTTSPYDEHARNALMPPGSGPPHTARTRARDQTPRARNPCEGRGGGEAGERVRGVEGPSTKAGTPGSRSRTWPSPAKAPIHWRSACKGGAADHGGRRCCTRLTRDRSCPSPHRRNGCTARVQQSLAGLRQTPKLTRHAPRVVDTPVRPGRERASQSMMCCRLRSSWVAWTAHIQSMASREGEHERLERGQPGEFVHSLRHPAKSKTSTPMPQRGRRTISRHIAASRWVLSA